MTKPISHYKIFEGTTLWHSGTISNTVPGGLAPTLGETVLGESPERET